VKRKNYDNPPTYSKSYSESEKNNFHQYQWKNPEFDPAYDHFKGQ
jgi:hypothetical protein